MSEAATEARLSREAATNFLGVLVHDDADNLFHDQTESARVEVTYADADEYERCGYFVVIVPSYDPSGMDDDEALAHHPATLAHDFVQSVLDEKAELEGWTYVSVDEVCAW